jgi:hypothetical protein
MLLQDENLEVKRRFIDYDGIEFVLKMQQAKLRTS